MHSVEIAPMNNYYYYYYCYWAEKQFHRVNGGRVSTVIASGKHAARVVRDRVSFISHLHNLFGK